jgi:hypothetical protein
MLRPKSMSNIHVVSYMALTPLAVAGEFVHAWNFMVALLIIVSATFVWSGIGYVVASLANNSE